MVKRNWKRSLSGNVPFGRKMFWATSSACNNQQMCYGWGFLVKELPAILGASNNNQTPGPYKCPLSNRWIDRLFRAVSITKKRRGAQATPWNLESVSHSNMSVLKAVKSLGHWWANPTVVWNTRNCPLLAAMYARKLRFKEDANGLFLHIRCWRFGRHSGLT